MYFYRHPGWGIGFKILIIVLIIAGGTFLARSAFQAGYLEGAAAEGAEMAAPYGYHHLKGYPFHGWGGSFLPILAIFFGGILLIKLIMSIFALITFNKWKKEAGPDWKGWKYGRFRPYPAHCGPFGYHGHGHGHWGPYPYPFPEDEGGEEAPDAPVEPDAG